MSLEIQEGMCTPLVMWVMGTSSSGKWGQTSFHMPLLTLPCSSLTPLLKEERRRASTVMQNNSPWSVG